jgi:hypothetical protein
MRRTGDDFEFGTLGVTLNWRLIEGLANDRI